MSFTHRYGRFVDYYHTLTKLRGGNVFKGICHSVGGLVSHVPCAWRGRGGYPRSHVPCPGGPHPIPLLLTSGGHHWKPVQTYSLEEIPHPLQYGWQAGGTHPTRMFSCFPFKIRFKTWDNFFQNPLPQLSIFFVRLILRYFYDLTSKSFLPLFSKFSCQNSERALTSIPWQ